MHSLILGSEESTIILHTNIPFDINIIHWFIIIFLNFAAIWLFIPITKRIDILILNKPDTSTITPPSNILPTLLFLLLIGCSCFLFWSGIIWLSVLAILVIPGWLKCIHFLLKVFGHLGIQLVAPLIFEILKLDILIGAYLHVVEVVGLLTDMHPAAYQDQRYYFH